MDGFPLHMLASPEGPVLVASPPAPATPMAICHYAFGGRQCPFSTTAAVVLKTLAPGQSFCW
ncbi:hypothetical protein O3P69_015181 [Scylla paramamosain]|uniref:Uncharacterized protein n=1 Tax=Scylla paramamosain TaxID=85552 RepID=A0AAW0T4W9_SCYPA